MSMQQITSGLTNVNIDITCNSITAPESILGATGAANGINLQGTTGPASFPGSGFSGSTIYLNCLVNGVARKLYFQ